ncbi:hypothetical protein CB1_001286009 [Camelus ferus]|nr:hypothetical protein CB1_001286009 [Camelus ferus]
MLQKGCGCGKGKVEEWKQNCDEAPKQEEVFNVSPGYTLLRNREQISVSLGDEMFDRKKQSESENMDKVKMSRELEEAHAAQLSELEENYKAALKAEKLAAKDKLEEMGKEYKYLKNMFHVYQDSIYDELEDKWSKKKAEWEKDEKLEREKILLWQSEYRNFGLLDDRREHEDPGVKGGQWNMELLLFEALPGILV